MSEAERAYQKCKQMMMTHSKSFYKAFSLLPSRQKKAVWAVYAFCRYADDLVDEGNQPARDLAHLEEELEHFLSGGTPKGDIWVALADVFDQFAMDPLPFRHMLQGQRMDIEPKPFLTLADVEQYSYYVAGTVGLMLLPFLAPDTRDLLEKDAVKLGKAMQLTNILRDVGEDLHRGRIYLPQQLLNEHHVDLYELAQSATPSTKFQIVWETIATRAESLYDEALTTVHLYPAYSRQAIKGSAYVYRAILDKIRAGRYEVFTKRHFVSQTEKQFILAKL
ncbi:phytoene/squalene synthase family protein [Bacillaceae bacterium SIJ1]|uniref:phytoene/squalene synthase family protein n=1 Tax=Litoribacterium kuwaitense TaxID=1398745 RepID=UPI0013EC4864|nr:phytoene/squalene synthase family protein [Litoribacterium kuwaitense]NGP44532.1 phytoene/squalene synthase family protein [Litoribacterium kuwaitense]